MTLKASAQHLEDEEEHGEELVLVAVRYVGGHQLYTDNAVRTQGYWPSYGGFTQGVTEVAFVPDRGLGYFENRGDFEIEYTEEAIAAALLEKNFLAPEVFETGAGGGDTRRRVLDKLGIERLETTNEGIREQLADIAGEDVDPGEEAERSLADSLASPDDGYTRSTLKAAAEELRDGPDDVSLSSGKSDLARWLASLVEDGDMSQSELTDAIEGASD